MSDAQTPQQLFDPTAYLDLTLTDPTEKRPPSEKKTMWDAAERSRRILASD